MRRRLSPILSMTTSVAACAIVGCASNRTTDTRRLPVQVEPSSQVELPQPSVSWEQNVLNVSGVVRRKPGVDDAVEGHIHVDLVSADGELLDQVLLRWIPSSIPVDGARESTYSANYGWQPPPNARVRIAILDDEQEHAFPGPEVSGGGAAGTAAGAPRGMGTPGTLGQPKTGKARGTPGTPKQKTSTPRTPGGGRGGKR